MTSISKQADRANVTFVKAARLAGLAGFPFDASISKMIGSEIDANTALADFLIDLRYWLRSKWGEELYAAGVVSVSADKQYYVDIAFNLPDDCSTFWNWARHWFRKYPGRGRMIYHYVSAVSLSYCLRPVRLHPRKQKLGGSEAMLIARGADQKPLACKVSNYVSALMVARFGNLFTRAPSHLIFTRTHYRDELRIARRSPP